MVICEYMIICNESIIFFKSVKIYIIAKTQMYPATKKAVSGSEFQWELQTPAETLISQSILRRLQSP